MINNVDLSVPPKPGDGHHRRHRVAPDAGQMPEAGGPLYGVPGGLRPGPRSHQMRTLVR